MGRKKDSAASLLVFGDLNIDMIGRVDAWPAPGGECLCPKLELHCGGVGANCAMAIAPWGIKVRLLGCVGQDRFGDLLTDTLRKTGVDIRGVQRSSRATTGILYINVTPDGQRTFFGSRSANQFMDPGQVPDRWLDSSAAAHLVGSWGRKNGKADPEAISYTRQAGFSRCWDGTEQANSQKNSPAAPPGGSAFGEQR
jgi:sugar/nucleoside kinase (ribokinase family)